MPLSPQVIERANAALSDPFSILRVDPEASDLNVADTCDTLADGLHDFLSVVGACADARTLNSIDPNALARLMWLHGRLFALYRVLMERRP